MTTDVVTLMQWLSPSYPVGAFAYSHGLETAIADGRINDAATLQDWLKVVLEHGSGRNDCTLLKAAHGSADIAMAQDVDAHARAVAASAERLMETTLQGAAFCQTTAAVSGRAMPDLTYPVAVGWAAGQAGFDATLTATLYLQSVASNLVSASVRAVPLGQTAGQRVLAGLAPLCQDIAKTATGDLDDLHSAGFASDIAAMRHETLQPRIFRS